MKLDLNTRWPMTKVRRYGEPYTDWNETGHTYLEEDTLPRRTIRNLEAVTIAERQYNGTPEGS